MRRLAIPTLVCLAVSPFATLADELTPPSMDGQPVTVTVGFLVLDFARITAREESFDLTAYVELSWRDPRLASPDAPAIRRYDLDDIWSPQVYFENAVEQPKLHVEPAIEVDREGKASRWVIISGKFSARMDLHRFPFDRQVLAVHLGPFEDETQVKLVVDPNLTALSDEAFATDWSIGEPSAHVESRAFQSGEDSYSLYTFRVVAERQSTFYIYRVLLPLTLLVAVSWAVFWFEPVGLQPQISTCMAVLIALVAFDFAIDFSLPKVSYLTLVDRHALIGFAFVTLTVGEVVLVHLAVKNDQIPRALKIQRTARWVVPAGYLIAAAMNLNALLVDWVS